MKITTNWNKRPILDASDLTAKEAKEFGYLDWDKLEKGEDSASFFRYKGNVYDLGEFSRIESKTSPWVEWDGIRSDSFFSGILVKYVEDDFSDYSVIAGTYID